ncbi:hypothetical protein KDK95_29015 [Actinospica sp. MGRD01-02]|uniref:Uncharacterized protein n=1 Tax=Actinospica acidithermotolerans TaxID=2828514 RepID=A0A941EJS4_9ACTN|nr:hypothetical protein [Actinospica acidithermotolerans]MBR7830379.1 hypothetical protein [Actinospica acidithermotolerans]
MGLRTAMVHAMDGECCDDGDGVRHFPVIAPMTPYPPGFSKAFAGT